MSRGHCVSLDDQQLRLVQQGPKLLPQECRDWFLVRVADRLGNTDHPTILQVHDAVTTVLTSARIPVPLTLDQELHQ